MVKTNGICNGLAFAMINPSNKCSVNRFDPQLINSSDSYCIYKYNLKKVTFSNNPVCTVHSNYNLKYSWNT